MESNLYLSAGYARRRVQRTSGLLRLAGAAVLLTAALQLAAVAGYWLISQAQSDEDARGGALAVAKKGLEDKLKPFNDTQAKYATIMGWMPVLKDRLPITAVLAYAQEKLPAELALRDLVMRTDESTPTPAGYRWPKKYALDLIGFSRSGPPPLETIAAAFPGLPARSLPLPTGSENVRPALWHVVVAIDPASASARTLFRVSKRKASEVPPLAE